MFLYDAVGDMEGQVNPRRLSKWALPGQQLKEDEVVEDTCSFDGG